MIGRARRAFHALMARPPAVDLAVFSLLVLSLAVELLAVRAYGQHLSPRDERLILAITLPMLALVLVRRVIPFTVSTWTSVAQFLGILFVGLAWPGSFTVEWCMYVGVYTVAARKSPRWAFAAIAVGTLAFAPVTAKERCECMLQIFTLLSFAALAGAAMTGSQRLIEELRWQAGLLQRTRDSRLRLAVEEERSRVARDLHDVVAHGVTVMVVQAGAARVVARTDPDRSRDILVRLDGVVAGAIEELRSLIGTLEVDGDRSDERVLPGLADVPRLIDQERAAGRDVSFLIEGDAHVLGSAMDISLYRIVQEALTNASKHAPGSAVTVTLRYLPEALEVGVLNAPSRTVMPNPIQGFGRGLIGIRERSALFGGEMRAGRTREGGFDVSVRLPLELVPA